MTIKDWLEKCTDLLTKAGISTARLDCLVLLEDATDKDRSWLLAHPDRNLTDLGVIGPSYHSLQAKVERRARHEPLAYIRGKTEFYGREFVVNKHVLVPRPESETMIALALMVIGERFEVRDKKTIVIDVGTGSGCLAVTMKLEIPESEVVATDISSECLKVAKQNAVKLGANVEFCKGNLLQPFYNLSPTTYTLVLANLPYVPDSHTINRAATHEPKIAIFGGPDGLDHYRQLFLQIANNLQFDRVKWVITESLPFQHKALAYVAKQHGYKLVKTEDFIQMFQPIALGRLLV